MNEAELQEDVQRFTTGFMFGVVEAVRPIEQRADPELREKVLRRVLVLVSTALDIATGPFPEINLVDMLVFVTLSDRAVVRHRDPELSGEESQALKRTFSDGERELWTMAEKVLSGDQQQLLREMIAAWEREHPDQVAFEGVRFQEFAARVGKVTSERAGRTHGLFGQFKSATQSADQALLIGQRAMFLVHRLPFLARLQARLGVHEAFGDSMRQLKKFEQALDVPQMRPAVAQAMTDVERRVDRLMMRATGYLLLLGAGGAAFFWGGYYLAKRNAA